MTKLIEVEILDGGKTAKTLNPFGCYELRRKPHRMDYEESDEFELQLAKFIEAEKDIKTYEIEPQLLYHTTEGPVYGSPLSLMSLRFTQGRYLSRTHNGVLLPNGKLNIID